MGKCPLMPNMLPEKMLEAPLTTATLASVPTKNSNRQPDTSTSTSTVVATNTTRMIKRDDRMRTFGDNLQESELRVNDYRLITLYQIRSKFRDAHVHTHEVTAHNQISTFIRINVSDVCVCAFAKGINLLTRK